MSQIGQDRGIGFLRRVPSVKNRSINHKNRSYFVKSVGERVLCAWRCAEDFPVVNNEFVTTRGGLSLGDRLQSPHKLYRRLKCKGEGLVRLCLGSGYL